MKMRPPDAVSPATGLTAGGRLEGLEDLRCCDGHRVPIGLYGGARGRPDIRTKDRLVGCRCAQSPNRDGEATRIVSGIAHLLAIRAGRRDGRLTHTSSPAPRASTFRSAMRTHASEV